MYQHHINPSDLTFERIEEIIAENYNLELSEESVNRIKKCRDYLDRKIAASEDPVYGVTTGFGSLCNHAISNKDLSTLQKNLVMSHACGVGEPVDKEIVKLMLLFKIQSLSYGNSGVELKTIERLVDMYNNNILPVVYNQGSLGASGDLTPLAHLSLPLLGMGEVWHNGEKKSAGNVLQHLGWEPLELSSKEGLALLNGTQFMSSIGVWCILKARRLSKWADIIGAMSLDAYDGRIEPFHEQVHKIRHHEGQIETAKNIRLLLQGSELINRKKNHVQDPYSFRCIPQVHGASKDTLRYVENVFFNEVNGVTDNPTIFPDDDLIISAGNFHGQPLALALDYLGIALAELGNISERRVYRLVSGSRQLPSFLVAKPGLNSGFMIPQYTAASLVSQNKQLCTPASVDSIESSQGQEDHVSMGANAAVKALQITKNLEQILAIELFNACQAIEFRRPSKSSTLIERVFKNFRESVPFIENDTVMYPLMKKSVEVLIDTNPDFYFFDK